MPPTLPSPGRAAAPIPFGQQQQLPPPPPPPPMSNTSRLPPVSRPPSAMNELPPYQSSFPSSSALASSTYSTAPQTPQGLTPLPPPPASPIALAHRASPRIPNLPASHDSPYDSNREKPFLSSPHTPRHHPASSTSGSESGGYRPLNVRDALTYLDQVKVRFQAQSDVYNHFLDIMKDFKSQAIDTPGVIERVSLLFHGHPELISGFNTFLPPGYRIECSTDPNEPDVIRVTTPSGSTLTRTTRPVAQPSRSIHGYRHSSPSHPSAPHPQPPMAQHLPPPTAPQQPPPPPPPPSLQQQQQQQQQHHHQPLPPPPPSQLPPHSASYYPAYSASSSSASLPPPPGLSAPPPHPYMPTQPAMPPQPEPPVRSYPSTNGDTEPKRPPIEFNHAINYVNRIKSRFINEPDIYKQFLEILQTYQKERRPIQEVYGHVQYLFQSAPDLLYEFKQFLPEITGQPINELFDEDDAAYPPGSKRGMYRPAGPYSPPGKKKQRVNQQQQAAMSKDAEEDQVNGFGSTSYYDSIRASISSDEIELFDHIRNHIGNKPSYEEFLKILNLYTQQVIDADVLVKQVEPFIGSDRELFDWFKSIVILDLKEHTIERPAVSIPKPDLNHCKTVESSPSYRLVSKEWQNQPCSGRDQLCWEVLNDEFVSHPIWASEDSGFVASKKNQYEEAMHRCEEERYDYDLNIDANLNTLALLEPIVKQLEDMSPEEKANFRLRPGLGGQSITIYERIIRKVYEEERGNEIIELLYSHPAKVVPIVAKRLALKDEEWRKAQHEWNKVWREMDAKNFYRALDYQGLTFKSNDRKAMATKSLIAELETLHDEYRSQDKALVSKYPLTFSFQDANVFRDITRLVFSYVEKQNGFSSNDRGKIRMFVRIFIPLFFHIDDVVPEGVALESDEAEDESGEDDDENHSLNTEDSGETGSGERSVSPATTPSATSSAHTTRRRSGRHRADEVDSRLLRDVLKRSKGASSADDADSTQENGTLSPSMARAQSNSQAPEDEAENRSGNDNEEGTAAKSEEPESVADEEEETLRSPAKKAATISESEDSKQEKGNRLFAAAAAATAPGLHKRTMYSFFCNNAFYCFFRLYQLLYERLLKMKQLDKEIAKDPKNRDKHYNKAAVELGLYSNRFDDIDLSKGYYQALLELVDRFFDGELDQAMFEEKSRYLFVTDAHVLFTVDKLIHSMIKQIQAVTMEEKSVELVELFRGDQTLDATCPRIVSVYRLRAEEIVGPDENLYKIEFNTETQKMAIRLLDKDDDMLEATPQDQYENYVASYMNWADTTDGVDPSRLKPTFLSRYKQ
ncbi:hypothetical protein BCR43DRAFT_463715 [Syncephalastrum racemosum]|uniref:Histone deacetylase interacting domain-containing protein n=1 Tax=Syncephalastrum racemosum TaxID=13706 RepID=A0A1X2H0T9_SYNRA|nr:hypothetical protein BCR43DRAFT_463715 [Syncephalastrum racemosum]